MKYRRGLYIASKTTHAARWRELRSSGVQVICTWIDEAAPGETKSLSGLWVRCVLEASSAEALLLYTEPGEVQEGGLVEVGAALGNDVPVIIVGEDVAYKFVNHPLVNVCKTLEEGLTMFRYMPRCTGITATWCPVHGDCRCEEYESGERSLSDDECPLHSRDSKHGSFAEDSI